MEESNGRDNPKVLEDAFEAFIGAMVEDLGKDEFEGYKICYQFIIDYLKVIDFAEVIKEIIIIKIVNEILSSKI